MSNRSPSTDLASTVCSSEQSISLDLHSFCHPPTPASLSPLDEFHGYLAGIIPLGTTGALEADQILGKVLLLGIVSAAEHYFRSIIAGLVFHCPVSRRRAATAQIAFGAVDHYPAEDLGYAFLEGVSLASAGEIGRQTAKITGLMSAQSGSVLAAMRQYEQLYHLRHAAVHSRGELGSHNLRELGLRGSGRQALYVSADGFQLASAVCLNAVRAYNRAVFAETMERLIITGSLTGEWRKDRAQVSNLYRLFHSRRDRGTEPRALEAYRALSPLILKKLTKAPQQPE